MAKLTIDGVEVETQEQDLPSLVSEDHLQKTGTRYGCGRGLCGACTVLVDGQAVRSCQLPVAALEGRQITTIEGLGANEEHPLRKPGKSIRFLNAVTVREDKFSQPFPCCVPNRIRPTKNWMP